MNKIIKAIKRFFYALPFGIKGADAELTGSGAESDGVVVSQQTTDNRVSNHLLKGEVTQEVEELRYRTYKVERESYGYDYVGNGVAIKKDKPKKTPNIIKFTQENHIICEGVLDGLKNLESHGIETYKIKLGYDAFPKIKLEKFITTVDVVIKTDKNEAITTINFSSIPNPSEFSSKPFVASLSALYEAFKNNDVRYVGNSDFNNIKTMFFVTTSMTDGEMNCVSYNFCNPRILSVKKENAEYKITYTWEKYDRTDLTDKFFSKSMAEKYANKERKDFALNISDNVEICHICGKKMYPSQGDIVQKKDGKPICLKCLLESENS